MTYNTVATFSEASPAVSMCTGPASNADVVPAGPLIPPLSVVVVQLAWQPNKEMGIIPWSSSMKSFTPCCSQDACAANLSRVTQN